MVQEIKVWKHSSFPYWRIYWTLWNTLIKRDKNHARTWKRLSTGPVFERRLHWTTFNHQKPLHYQQDGEVISETMQGKMVISELRQQCDNVNDCWNSSSYVIFNSGRGCVFETCIRGLFFWVNVCPLVCKFFYVIIILPQANWGDRRSALFTHPFF